MRFTYVFDRISKVAESLIYKDQDFKFGFRTLLKSSLYFAEGEFDDLDGQQARIKPEAIDTLCQVTKFSRRELQLMYRGFKQVIQYFQA